MTPAQKSSAIAKVYADAFEDIDNLLLTLDSHRNFHRRVEETIIQAKQTVRNIRETKETSNNHIPCQCSDPRCECCAVCPDKATYQVIGVDPDADSVFMCEACADNALATGNYHLAEEA